MQNNQKLLLAVLAAPLVGVLAFFLTSDRGVQQATVMPEQEVEDDGPSLVDLRDPGDGLVENNDALDFMESRWGHLGDAGMVTAHSDFSEGMFFVEPKIFVGRDGKGNKLYMRAIAKLRKLPSFAKKATEEDGRVRIPGNFTTPMVKPIVRQYEPITDPMDMPENLRDQHPLSPDYTGPVFGGN